MEDTVLPLPPASLLALLRGALRPRSGHGVPRTESQFRIDAAEAVQLAAQLEAYRSVLDFPPTPAVPLTFFYLIAQRAHVAAMVDPAFPFRLPGMIHVENALAELAPLAPDRALLVRNVLTIEAPTESGARYCLFDTVAEQDGKPVFRCHSRYLAVRGERRPKARLALDGALGETVGAWHLPPHEGRLYARASGDWNPIHLWPWSARLMGLKQPIIHGMHTVGKTCALLEQAAGRRIVQLSARFVAPISLGSTARLDADWQQGSYYVLAGGRLAVEGSFVVL